MQKITNDSHKWQIITSSRCVLTSNNVCYCDFFFGRKCQPYGHFSMISVTSSFVMDMFFLLPPKHRTPNSKLNHLDISFKSILLVKPKSTKFCQIWLKTTNLDNKKNSVRKYSCYHNNQSLTFIQSCHTWLYKVENEWISNTCMHSTHLSCYK